MAMDASEIERMIKDAFPDAQIEPSKANRGCNSTRWYMPR
jgi:hypothetical protein